MQKRCIGDARGNERERGKERKRGREKESRHFMEKTGREEGGRYSRDKAPFQVVIVLFGFSCLSLRSNLSPQNHNQPHANVVVVVVYPSTVFLYFLCVFHSSQFSLSHFPPFLSSLFSTMKFGLSELKRIGRGARITHTAPQA